MSFPRYPAYKDSGVEWLGNIPTHWETFRYRRLFAEVADLAETEDEELLTVSHLTGVTPRSEKNVNMFLAESLEGYKRCQEGDTVINTMWAWMGALGVVFQQGVVSPSYNVYRPRPEMAHQLEPRFFDRLYRTEAHIVEINRFSKGVWASRLRLYPQSFFEMTTVCPPFEEQRAIAAFLDAETARIDALVAKQEALITTLQEKRRALISHAVTKGLDPAAPMKDSGVPWLGEVPAHWDVKAIKWLSPVQRGASPRPIDDPKYFDDEGEYAWVRIADVTAAEDGYLRTTTQRLSPLGSSLSVKLEPGALFLSIAGSVGKPCISCIKACIHDGFVYFPHLKENSKFIFYIFEAGMAFQGLGKLGTQLNLNTDTVGSIRIGIPPKPEQDAIVAFIEQESERVGTLIAKAEQFIALLREHRTALIAAAVTGQIDVRGYAEAV